MNALERDYYTIEAIELMLEASQRDLAKYTGMSLGKVNYCLKELVQKGWIKAQEMQRTDDVGQIHIYWRQKGALHKAN